MKPQNSPPAISTGPPDGKPSNGHLDLRSLRVPAAVKYLIQHGDSIGDYSSSSEAVAAVLQALVEAGYDDQTITRLCRMETHGVSELPRQKSPEWIQDELMRVRRQIEYQTRQARGEPENSDDLMLDTILPSKPIIEDLLYEGMLLFGGKSKRGKSWLILDLAVSVATGTPVWGHFAVPEPQPVLYISLEDGRGRIRQRLDDIRPGVRTSGYLQFLYNFPMLDQGGLEKLRSYIESGRYRLIVIDVLAKIEPVVKRGSEKTYLEIYDMFAPLQALHRDNPLCVAMITHLRKAEAEDIFDTLHGSVGYQGVQDALWAMERMPGSDVAVIHTRPNDGREQVLHVSFSGGRWEFLGHDEEVRCSQDRRLIRELAKDTHGKGLSISDVVKGLSLPRERYQKAKQLVYRMVRDGQMMRIARGRYDVVRSEEKGNEGTQGNAAQRSLSVFD